MSEQAKTIIIIGVGIILATILIMFTSLPLWNNLQTTIKETKALKANADADKSYRDAVVAITGDGKYAEAKKSWSILVPTAPQAEIFSVILESLGNSTKVKQSSISFDESAGTLPSVKNITGKGFKVSGEADKYSDLMTYLERYSKLNQLNSIREVTLQPNNNKVGFSISGDIFYLTVSEPKTRMKENDFFAKAKDITASLIPYVPPTGGNLGRDNPF